MLPAPRIRQAHRRLAPVPVQGHPQADGLDRRHRDNITTHLAAGLPSTFGFTGYSSIPASGDGRGEIPFPNPGEKVEGGHAVLAVGYDNGRKIGSSKGALLIRNSWSTGWGDCGYGWLPYDYVPKGLANDFWALVQADFVDTELFK